MGYKQLDYRKRCQIYGLWRAGYNQTEIAKEVGVHKSTISREFKRNVTFVQTKLGVWDYKPDYAQCYADERHKYKNKQVKFIEPVKEFVTEKIKEDWSPDQISGYAKRHNLFNISHEWIYRFILSDKQNGGSLHKHLLSPINVTIGVSGVAADPNMQTHLSLVMVNTWFEIGPRLSIVD